MYQVSIIVWLGFTHNLQELMELLKDKWTIWEIKEYTHYDGPCGSSVYIDLPSIIISI